MAALPERVNRARGELLAAPALAADQHREGRAGGQGDLRAHVAHDDAVADERVFEAGCDGRNDRPRHVDATGHEPGEHRQQ